MIPHLEMHKPMHIRAVSCPHVIHVRVPIRVRLRETAPWN